MLVKYVWKLKRSYFTRLTLPLYLFFMFFRLLVWGMLEFSWNTYPSTILSSAVLHGAHLILLYGLFRTAPELALKQQKKKKRSL